MKIFSNEIESISICVFRRSLRISVWNHMLSVGNHVLAETDILLSQIDWSKESIRDYILS